MPRCGGIAETTGRPHTEAVLDQLAGLYSGRLFRAFLHVWLAASVDEQLRARVLRGWTRSLDTTLTPCGMTDQLPYRQQP